MKRTHGKARTSIYRRWLLIRGRCENPRSAAYKNYGGRGIRLCDRWRSFSAFYADMGDPPGPGYSIDRVDNDGNYEPGNCRWVTRATQNRNTRRTRLVTCFGKTQCFVDWAREFGLSPSGLEHRLRLGFTFEEALTTKPTRPRQSPDITGLRYGRLTAVGYSHTVGKVAFWAFSCDCGNQVIRRAYSVKQRAGSSCGCRRSEAARFSRCG